MRLVWVTKKSVTIPLVSRLSRTRLSARWAWEAPLPSPLARQQAEWRTQFSKMELKSGVTSLGSTVTGWVKSRKTRKSRRTIETIDQLTASRSSSSRLHSTLHQNRIVMSVLRNHRIAAWAIILITMLGLANLNKQPIESVSNTLARLQQKQHLQRMKNHSKARWIISNKSLLRKKELSTIWMNNRSKSMKITKKNFIDSKRCRTKSWVCQTNFVKRIKNLENRMTLSTIKF